ncbi:MAG: hypothetical protein ACLT38_02995 [Akkermansia sp.]
MIQAGGIPCSSCGTSPLLIAGRAVLPWAGTFCNAWEYDNSRFPGWGKQLKPARGYHADHAAVDFQIPADARML